MRTVGIGRQDFEKIRVHHNFYVDKTDLIRQWWEADDDVTLVTRPRRFGKTLNMSMLEKFFSLEYAGRSELFEGFFSTLTPDQQQILMECADEAGLMNNDLYDDITAAAEQGMKDAGVEIYELTDADKQAWADAAQKFFDEATDTLGWSEEIGRASCRERVYALV